MESSEIIDLFFTVYKSIAGEFRASLEKIRQEPQQTSRADTHTTLTSRRYRASASTMLWALCLLRPSRLLQNKSAFVGSRLRTSLDTTEIHRLMLIRRIKQGVKHQTMCFPSWYVVNITSLRLWFALLVGHSRLLTEEALGPLQWTRCIENFKQWTNRPSAILFWFT